MKHLAFAVGLMLACTTAAASALIKANQDAANAAISEYNGAMKALNEARDVK